MCSYISFFSFLNTEVDIKETATAVNFNLMKLIALSVEPGEDIAQLQLKAATLQSGGGMHFYFKPYQSA